MPIETNSPFELTVEEQIKLLNNKALDRCHELMVGDFSENALIAVPGCHERSSIMLAGISRTNDPKSGQEGFRVHPTSNPNSRIRPGWYEVFPDTPPVWVSRPKPGDNTGNIKPPSLYDRTEVIDRSLSEPRTENDNNEDLRSFRVAVNDVVNGVIFDNREHTIVGNRLLPKKSVRLIGARAAEWLRRL